MMTKLFGKKSSSDLLFKEKGDGTKGLAQGESKLMATFFGMAIALGVGSLVVMLLVANNRALATRGKVLVQMTDGTTQIAQEYDVSYRRPEVIKETAVRWMQLSYEWDNRIPGNDKATDTGISVGGSANDRVPTKVYLASYLIQPGFRQEFLKLMATERIPQDVMSGRRKSMVRFYSVSDPRQVAKNRWEVDIVASRIERSATQDLGETKINRTITLQAVPPVQPLFKKDDPELWRTTLFELSKNGLMITEVKPLNLAGG
jgi:hypothetical protein